MTGPGLVESLRVRVPIGAVQISAKEGKIFEILLKPAKNFPLEVEEQEISFANTAVLKLAAMQIQEYFAGGRKKFSLPLCPQGKSDFSRKIYACLESIPYGEMCTYGELAVTAGFPRAARAVGQMMARNRFPLVLPCHRVIGCQGRMTGFSGGEGISTKEWLLKFEKTALVIA